MTAEPEPPAAPRAGRHRKPEPEHPDGTEAWLAFGPLIECHELLEPDADQVP